VEHLTFDPRTVGYSSCVSRGALVLQVQIDNNGGTAVGGGGPKASSRTAESQGRYCVICFLWLFRFVHAEIESITRDVSDQEQRNGVRL